jgi:hypothetical protein
MQHNFAISSQMTAPVKIRFKGPPVPRAKPIPPELWDKHKAELFFLHRSNTLDQIMKEMTAKHDFTPS